MALPGLRLHSHKGPYKEFFAVDVSGNWRVLFRSQGADAFDVNDLDDH